MSLTGKYHTQFRDYDPLHCKWLSRDPIAEAGGVNLTGYCGNNALDYVDEMGLADTVVGNIVQKGNPLYWMSRVLRWQAGISGAVVRNTDSRFIRAYAGTVGFAQDFVANALDCLDIGQQTEDFAKTVSDRINTEEIQYKVPTLEAIKIAAHRTALDVNPVGLIIQGAYGKSLDPWNPMEKESWDVRATKISGGVGGTAGLAGGALVKFGPAGAAPAKLTLTTKTRGPRSGATGWKRLAEKPWKKSIIGLAQRTKTPGHRIRIYRETIKMAKSGQYEKIYLNRAYRTATGFKTTPKRLPDIIGIRKTGPLDIVEIPSRTDTIANLVRRNIEAMKQLPRGLRSVPRIEQIQ